MRTNLKSGADQIRRRPKENINLKLYAAPVIRPELFYLYLLLNLY